MWVSLGLELLASGKRASDATWSCQPVRESQAAGFTPAEPVSQPLGPPFPRAWVVAAYPLSSCEVIRGCMIGGARRLRNSSLCSLTRLQSQELVLAPCAPTLLLSNSKKGHQVCPGHHFPLRPALHGRQYLNAPLRKTSAQWQQQCALPVTVKGHSPFL